MSEITAGLVKELREKTGVGMMDCKRALAESGGDMEAAVDWLRKKGLAAAAKKAGRIAADGLVGIHLAGNRGAIVEVNSETDFVARNELFQHFVGKVAELALESDSSMDDLLRRPFPGTERTVGEHLTDLIVSIGENMALRRIGLVTVSHGVVGAYVHSARADGMGRIGVLVGLESDAAQDVLADLGRKVAMHIAAANPQAVRREEVDPSALDRERNVLMEQAAASGKPAAVIAKMVEGRLNKFYEEACLLEQTFVIDGETKVADAIAKTAAAVGSPITVTKFLRFALGEGIEKKPEGLAEAAAG